MNVSTFTILFHPCCTRIDRSGGGMHWFIIFLSSSPHIVRDCTVVVSTRHEKMCNVHPPHRVSSNSPVLLSTYCPPPPDLLASVPSPLQASPRPCGLSITPTPGWTLSRVVHSVSARGSCQLSTGYGNVEIREFSYFSFFLF